MKNLESKGMTVVKVHISLTLVILFAGSVYAGQVPACALYEAVLPVLLQALEDWKAPKDLAEELEVRRIQLDDWIKRALEEGIMKSSSFLQKTEQS